MKQYAEQLIQGEKEALARIAEATTADELAGIRREYLGKKGSITAVMKQLGNLDPEDRPKLGALVNTSKQRLETSLAERQDVVQPLSSHTTTPEQELDVTQPGTRPLIGTMHPISQMIRDIRAILSSMGFVYAEGPEVELDYYTFEALNMPKHHPSRDTQDSFFISDDVVMRTQTSAVQIRVMEKQQPPIRMYSIGKCYRRDYDVSHTPMFHQFEGLVVDKHITLADLKGVMQYFMRALFGHDTRVRFRPHHFPFTEPSLEPDVTCSICQGKGCRSCKYTGWLEMGGAGMVNAQVFRNVGYDPEQISGFAFGFGIERPLMIKYRVDDIRLLFENDIRFLQQF